MASKRIIRSARVRQDLFDIWRHIDIEAGPQVGDSAPGQMIEHKDPRTRLFKWGNDLRQSYRTLGQAVGLFEIDTHLHSVAPA